MRGKLFRVEKDGELVAHLLGTLHIGTLDQLAIPSVALDFLMGARTLLVEVAPTANDVHYLSALQRLPRGQRLDRLIGRRSFAALVRLTRGAGFGAADLNELRPLTALMLVQFKNQLPEQSLDEFLVDRATATGIRVVGLESWSELIKASTCLSLREEALVLRKTLLLHERFPEVARRMIGLYADGQIEELLEYAISALPLPSDARRLDDKDRHCSIDQRNVVMGQRLAKHLEGGGVFVAVGAFHLIGPNGLIEKLRSLGYSVSPSG